MKLVCSCCKKTAFFQPSRKGTVGLAQAVQYFGSQGWSVSIDSAASFCSEECRALSAKDITKKPSQIPTAQ